MGQLRNAARVYALDARSPGQVVMLLNDLLHELGPGDMATMVAAVLDPDAQTLTTASAGHPPPLVIGADGAVSFLDDVNGPPVGAVPRVSYAESTIPFASGSTLVLYTDGLVEDRLTPLDMGLNRLRCAIDGTHDDLEALCDRALESVGDSCEDDAAVLAVRPSALSGRLTVRLPTDPTTLPPLRAALRRWLRHAGATEDEAYEILVAAGEAAANAIRHTRWAEGGYYEVDAVGGDGICIAVQDTGSWRPRRDDGGGRGLQLIHAFMDDVDITRTPHGTTVTMSRRLGPRTMQGATP